jgi:predicted permease
VERITLFQTLLACLIPVCFCVAIGALAGWLKILDTESVRSISTYVVIFALPCLLFVGIFKFTVQELSQWQNLVTLLVAMTATWAIAYVVGRFIWRFSSGEAAIMALTSSFPNMAYIGVAVLTTLFSTTGLLPVILGNFVSSFVLIPVTVLFLHMAGGGKRAGSGNDIPAGTTKAAPTSSLARDILHTVVQPLVWAPLLGIALVLVHFTLPELASKSIGTIGDTAGGVALFAVGVMLFGFSFRIDPEVATVFVLKNLVQPAIAAAVLFAFGLRGVMAEGIVIVLACPAATACPMLASSYRVGEKSAAASVAVSTVSSLLTLSGWILCAKAAFAG